jgi:Xaa-Pro aminopeptidase
LFKVENNLNYNRRLNGLQDKMKEDGLDLVIYGPSPNFQYISGMVLDWRKIGGYLRNRLCHLFDEEQGRVNVFISREGDPILTMAAPARVGLRDSSIDHLPASWIKDLRVIQKGESFPDFIKKVLNEINYKDGSVGLGGRIEIPALLDFYKTIKGAKIKSAENLMDDLRMIKEPEEIKSLKKVSELSVKVIEETIPKIQEGITRRELSLEIESIGRKYGAQDSAFPATLLLEKSGSTSGDPLFSNEKGIMYNTSIAFDIGFVMDGYCSDCGISAYFGKPQQETKNAYNAMQRAMEETAEKMYDSNMSVSQIFPNVVNSLQKDGFEKHLRTLTPGHQIGIEVHEPPWLKAGSTQLLKSGMVMCLEPKLYHKGEYYLRAEDLILVKKDKGEFLTKFDREIFEI